MQVHWMRSSGVIGDKFSNAHAMAYDNGEETEFCTTKQPAEGMYGRPRV